ncbi:insulinase family protein [Roseovarius gahaiensis]|uniref:Insulinase family protein n=1 Tax=Roseovarius gahaiensis TaxID=2716691 RepID=A0A967BBW8_9RHOB|nr:pitrilysin family protein [Roseovarius gahaiensis]NHQ73221.1 insulinase family protein [Roseovarius gahaiensis]
MIRLLLPVLALCAALPAWAEVNIKEMTTPGGIDAWLVEEHSIPFVALELRFQGGTSLDPQDKDGVTNLMVGLLEEGAGDMDARAFARETEALAASFRYDASDDSVGVSARFLTENRDEAVALLRESLVNPSFDQSAIDRVRAQVNSIIRSNQKDPRDIAGDAFAKLVYGDHPYGRPEYGTLDSVAELTREDIVKAHRAALTRDRLYVSAVGDITEQELAALLDDLLLDLPETGAGLPGAADINMPGGIQIVEFDTPQSVVMFGQPGIDRDDPDFFAAYILNHILGGGSFESRLMQEVREKRGLTYGVYSYLANKDHADLWLGSVASANGRIAESIDVIRSEWDRLRSEGVTQAELNDAKTYLTGAYPLRFDGNAPIANIAVSMQMEGLETDYISNRNDMVNAVTLEDVNRVAQELVDPAKLTFVVVGQPEGLTSSIKPGG